MARSWRIENEGALCHAFSSGNNQQDLFFTGDLFKEKLRFKKEINCLHNIKMEGYKKLKKEVLNTAFGSCPVDMSDEDILDAMKSIPGYLDITPGDFKEIFSYAYRHAVERIAQSLLAKDVMTTGVISVTSTSSLKETAATMATHSISGLPVIDDQGRVVGVISEKDFLSHMGEKKTRSFMNVIAQCLTNKGCEAISMRIGNAKDIMTSPAHTVVETTPIFEIASIFAEKSINRVPVVDKNDHLLGIVARADIFQTTCML
jgi:CBS domain-containing protein